MMSNPRLRPHRRRIHSRVAAIVLTVVLSSCSQGKDKIVDLDLRQPTTPKQLNSASATAYSVRADKGALLKLTMQLPDATVTGEFESLIAEIVVPSTGPDSLLANVVLFDRDVETLAEVTAIVQDFENEWGIKPESIPDRDAFLLKAAGFVDSKGRPQNTGDGADPNFVFGIQGLTKGTLRPSLTIRPGNGYFSTYRSFGWDPLASTGTGSS
jgi:hypothetical protein